MTNTIPLGPTPAKHTGKGLTPFALGFRPFFLLAGIAAVGLITLWLPMWVGYPGPVSYYGMIGWHSHEMLFGYAMAVIAGFLLTAVRNWTGIDTPTGAPLAGLALLWLAGRLVPFIHPLLPEPLPALIDWLFIPALMLALGRPLWLGANKVNRVFLPILALAALANGMTHAQTLGYATVADLGTELMLNTVFLLIALVAGRVLPFFTEKAVQGSRPRRSPLLERWSFAALLALMALELLYPAPVAVGVLAALVAVTQALRLVSWHHPGAWRIPILWVLFTGFGWLVLGFALKALGAFGLFPSNLAVHALTLGGFGVLTLGMMARVALGHTGRDLRSARIIDLAFGLLNLGAIVRVFGPLIIPNYTTSVHLSGGLWLLAFILFLIVYAPILLKPRVDGRPG